jgi:hypothetical protein
MPFVGFIVPWGLTYTRQGSVIRRWTIAALVAFFVSWFVVLIPVVIWSD